MNDEVTPDDRPAWKTKSGREWRRSELARMGGKAQASIGRQVADIELSSYPARVDQLPSTLCTKEGLTSSPRP